MSARHQFTPEEKQAFLEDKQRRAKELDVQVKNLVASFKDSDTFKTYLSKMSDFNRLCAKHLHRYSPQNLLYIMTQDPNAQLVASFGAWKKMGRSVTKGEKSHIQVWAPMKSAVMHDVTDKNGQPVLDTNGRPKREPERDDKGRIVYKLQGRAFKLEPVFDISQTNGEPLPTLTSELKNPVEHFEEYFSALKTVTNLPVYMSDDPQASAINLRSAKGVCSFSDQMIVVKAGMSEEHSLKTLVHEVTHSLLHSPEARLDTKRRTGEEFTHNEIEVQAECTAFVVCNHLGLDTSEYSIPYIVSWSEDERLSSFNHSLGVIMETSDTIIDQMETQLWVEMGIDEKLTPEASEPEISPSTVPVAEPEVHVASSALKDLQSIQNEPSFSELLDERRRFRHQDNEQTQAVQEHKNSPPHKQGDFFEH